jgi:hypothetical protein
VDEKKENWRDRAACRGRIDLFASFFPDGSRPEIDPVVAELCAHCPVRKECSAFGFAEPERSGVWGGKVKVPESLRRVQALRASRHP